MIHKNILNTGGNNYDEKYFEKITKKLGKYEWEDISEDCELSEDFIREFQDKVDWKRISEYQTLSEGFKNEFKDNIDWI